MDQGTLTIYSASAGSGKTFRLAGIYLARLFKSKFNYRRILAVTFTNKATAEMKDRILEQLHRLASGNSSEYLDDLIKETGKSAEVIRQEAGEILFAILHDFSRFSVCTIDAFFQRVIRAFARERGLYSGFGIELDHSRILSDAVDEMIAESAVNDQLRKWLNSYVMASLDDEKGWNLKGEITKLSEELFREKFKILSHEERTKLESKEFLSGYINELRSLTAIFRNTLKNYGQRCQSLCTANGVTDDMFYYKGAGIPSFIRSMCQGIVKGPSAHARKAISDPPKWASGGSPAPQLKTALDEGLGDSIRKAIQYFDNHICHHKSAVAVLENIFALGILSDVLLKVREISSSENSFLISDAGELLSLITEGDQAPFIYEKIGNTYENFMIDEFQDTSQLQWNNFDPLIRESMSAGHDNLVVGDVKQSIYRFRNSDWQILGRMKDELVDCSRFISRPLQTNWRSCSEIIKFNNFLFSVIPQHLDLMASEEGCTVNFAGLYSEAVQEDPGKRKGGYVRIEFIDDERAEEKMASGRTYMKKTKSWRQKVLDKLPGVIDDLLVKGYNPSDIGILVRDSRDGADVLSTLISYNNNLSPSLKENHGFNIISSDSLLLSGSPAIIFIISVLRILNDPDDDISRAAMKRFYLLACGKDDNGSALHISDKQENDCGDLPEGYITFLEKARQMTLFEATESIIGFFGIGRYNWNVTYLDAFQDWVLAFSKTKDIDFGSFLEWWDITGCSRSVVLPSSNEAVRVLTIHKSKGLEFRVVIIPFISWNLDHKNNIHPVMWLKPGEAPFNSLGIVPVRYDKELVNTIFAGDYLNEKYSAFIDNINLLYVAFTRAIEVLYGFAPAAPGHNSGITGVLRQALDPGENPSGLPDIAHAGLFDREALVYESGYLTEVKKVNLADDAGYKGSYDVNPRPGSLRLKLHGENYFSDGSDERRQKISYGNLMHEIFEGIGSIEDIPAAVRKMVLEGKITDTESDELKKKLNSLVSSPGVEEWFRPGAKVMKEATILLPSGAAFRPDRVIIKDECAVIVDFKFGEENRHHLDQIREYRSLLTEMGYRNTEAYLWYVDSNKIITA